MMLCERIGLAPDIGNIFNGINMASLLDNYVIKYSEQSLEKCSKCWLIRLCPICYQQAFFDYSIDIKRKSYHCEQQRHMMLKDLAEYCSLREIDDMDWTI